MQMLLDPLKEDLNLPSFPIKFCNCDCINREVIGEGAINLPISKVFIYNKSKVVRILSGSIKSGKLDCFIGDKFRLGINFSILNDLVKHIIFGSGDKLCVILVKVFIERVNFHIDFIHKIVAFATTSISSITLES